MGKKGSFDVTVGYMNKSFQRDDGSGVKISGMETPAEGGKCVF